LPLYSSERRPSRVRLGEAPGVVVGGLIIRTLDNGMSILEGGSEFDQLIKGLALLAAVAIDAHNRCGSGVR
jgi:putative multiple sugar transport system permease protein